MTPRHDVIPPFGTGPYGDAPARKAVRDEPSVRGEHAAVRERIVGSMERSLRSLLVAIGRDYAHCGKAACKRARRCRGFACEPDVEDET